MGLNGQHGPRIIQKLNLILLSLFFNSVTIFFFHTDTPLLISWSKKKPIKHTRTVAPTQHKSNSLTLLIIVFDDIFTSKTHLNFINEPEIRRWKNIEANMYTFPYKRTLTFQEIEYILVKIERWCLQFHPIQAKPNMVSWNFFFKF